MPTIVAAFFEVFSPAFWMSVAGLARLVVGLWTYVDRSFGGSEYRSKTRGPYLLRRHSSVWRNDSFARLRHAACG
jgi:hypothetical protein